MMALVSIGTSIGLFYTGLALETSYELVDYSSLDAFARLRPGAFGLTIFYPNEALKLWEYFLEPKLEAESPEEPVFPLN
jgi:hypothetical protein